MDIVVAVIILLILCLIFVALHRASLWEKADVERCKRAGLCTKCRGTGQYVLGGGWERRTLMTCPHCDQGVAK